jgi:PTH1 family peptidyl-tRNA hydrolase
MKIFLGLGNPGDKYIYTRHNIGFLFVEFLHEKYGSSSFRSQSRFRAEVAEGQICGEKVLFVKPQTFMNLSGESLMLLKNFYSFNVSDIWVFQDDLDLPFETLRFKAKSSHGGNNGIRSLIQHLGTQEFRRIKFGIRNESITRMPAAAFVLQKFSKEERAVLAGLFKQAEKLFLNHVV